MIDHQLTANPLQLFEQVQSAHLALPKRLRALGKLLRSVDALFTTRTAQSSPPAATLLAPQTSRPAPTPTVDEHQHSGLPFDNVDDLITTLNQLVNHQLLPLLKQYQLQVAKADELTQPQLCWLHGYFRKRLYPLLTPLAVDPGHPFPRLVPGALYFLVSLRTASRIGRRSALPAPSHPSHLTPATMRPATWPGSELYSLLKISEHGPRLLPVRAAGAETDEQMKTLFLRENLVKLFLSELFVGMEIVGAYQFRASCAATQPTLTHIEVEETMPPHLVLWLINHLQVAADAVLHAPLPLGMADLSELVDSCLSQQPRVADAAR